jgi:hypothetical protein
LNLAERWKRSGASEVLGVQKIQDPKVALKKPFSSVMMGMAHAESPAIKLSNCMLVVLYSSDEQFGVCLTKLQLNVL